jgi:hypothetical protein
MRRHTKHTERGLVVMAILFSFKWIIFNSTSYRVIVQYSLTTQCVINPGRTIVRSNFSIPDA